MGRPERPTAIITGASRGIGEAIARAMAPDHDLILSARDAPRLEALAPQLEAAGAKRVRVLPCDLADTSARRTMIEALVGGAHGVEIDILVNNAGVAASSPIRRTSDEMWERTLELNLTAPFELMRALLPGMAERSWGRVINVASTAGLKGYRYTSAYSASKAGLLGLTRSTALEFVRKGVTINAICPGFTETDISREAIGNIVAKTGQSESDARASLEAFSPQGRLMKPGEIGSMVHYLCGDAAHGVTGQAIAVDGGETA